MLTRWPASPDAGAEPADLVGYLRQLAPDGRIPPGGQLVPVHQSGVLAVPGEVGGLIADELHLACVRGAAVLVLPLLCELAGGAGHRACALRGRVQCVLVDPVDLVSLA